MTEKLACPMDDSNMGSAFPLYLQDAGMDVALLIASTVALAGPLSGFCEEPGLVFSLQARAGLHQGPSQAATRVLDDKKLEDEVPDDGIKSNQLAIATELVRRLLLVYFGKRRMAELTSPACAVGCG